MSELDDLIEGTDESVETPEVVETEVVETEVVETKGEEEAAPPAAEQIEKEPVLEKSEQGLYESMKAERAARQAAQAELAELREQLNAEPPPNPIDDPEGALQHLRDEMTQEMWRIKSELSRSQVSLLHPDYAEKEAVFMEMVDANPLLAEQIRQADNPALFAYETAKSAEEYQQMQDLPAYKEKLKAELREELLAEQAQAGDRDARTQAALTAANGVGDLATTRASNPITDNTQELSEILDGR